MKTVLGCRLCCLLIVLCFCQFASSQTFNIAKSTVAYSSIAATGTPMTGWRNSNSTDDNLSTAQDIGFSFTYKGVTYSQYSASTNGYLTFNVATTSIGNGTGAYGYQNNAFSASSGNTNNSLAIFYEDLVCLGTSSSKTTLDACIKSRLTGTSPNRVLTIEWINMGTFNNDGPNLNFQIKLYETSNVIEYCYGTIEGFRGISTFAYSYTLGLNGSTISSTPTAAELQTQQVENQQNFSNTAKNDLTRVPDCGTKYTFTPGTYGGVGSAPGAPANDNTAGAITLSINNGLCTALCGTLYTTKNATATASIAVCNATVAGTPDDDVWFKFVATNTQHAVSIKGAGTFDGVLQIFNSSFTSLRCKNATGAGSTETDTASGLTVGSTYYVRVYDAGATAVTAPDFSICVYTLLPAPDNDEICGAIALTLESPCSNTGIAGSTLNASASSQTACTGTPDDDVWYKFMATRTSQLITVTSGISFNAHVQVFSSSDNTCSGTLTSIACVNSSAVGVTEYAVASGLTVGNTYFVRVYNTSLGAGNGLFTISLKEGYYWTGTSNTTYSNADNWCPSLVPPNSAPIIIPAVSNQPVLSANLSVSGNLDIASGASLTIGSFTLTLSGTISGTGVLIGSSTSNLSVTGSSTLPLGTIYMSQAINGSTNMLNNFTVNRSAGLGSGVIIGNNVIVRGTFTPTAGTITTNNNLTLNSDKTSTARVAPVGTAALISGNVTVKRYIPSGSRKFRFLGHPFSSNTNLSQLTDSIDITGAISGSNANGFTPTVSNNPSAFTFNEANADGGTIDAGWTAFASGNTPSMIEPGQGIRVLIRGSKGQANSLNNGSYIPDSVTLAMTGPLKQGSFTQNLSFTDVSKGWNLISNPYASNVNWTSVTRTNVDNAIYTYRPSLAGGNWGSFINGTAANGGSQYIEAYSSFFVRTNAASPTLGWAESNKVTNLPTNSVFRTNNNINNRMSLTLINDATGSTDEVVTRFGDDPATDEFDGQYDALNLPGASHDLFVLDSKNTQYSIFHGTALRSVFTEKREIKLGLRKLVPGIYSFIGKTMDAFIGGNHIYLKDEALNTLTEIADSTIYKFTVNTSGDLFNRFSLIFNAKEKTVEPLLLSFSVKLSPNPVSGVLNVSYQGLNEQYETTIRILDMKGRIVKILELGPVNTGNQLIMLKDLSSGIYSVQFQNGDTIETKTIIKN